MTRYATVRLLAAALLAVLVVGGTTASEYAAGGRVGVGAILLALPLGVVTFGVVAVVLLLEVRRHLDYALEGLSRAVAPAGPLSWSRPVHP